jgi:hypothetical protein
MTAQGGTAALFDGRHDLQLPEAQVAARLLTQSRPVGAEDIRDLQGEAIHARLRCWGWARLQRTDHLAQDLGRDMGVERCCLEPMS